MPDARCEQFRHRVGLQAAKQKPNVMAACMCDLLKSAQPTSKLEQDWMQSGPGESFQVGLNPSGHAG